MFNCSEERKKVFSLLNTFYKNPYWIDYEYTEQALLLTISKVSFTCDSSVIS